MISGKLALFASFLASLILSGIAPAAAMNQTHMVPVLASPLARGDVIREEILVDREMKLPPYGVNYFISRDDLIGKAAKRPLRAGAPLRATDVSEPKLIKKGELVMVVFEAPGLNLAIRGKALEDGVLLQAVRVMNTQTGRTFEGTVTAPGYVLASPPPSLPAAPAAGIQYSPYSRAAIRSAGNQN